MALSLRHEERRSLPEKVQTPPAKVRSLPNSPVDTVEIADSLDLLSLIETARVRASLKLDYLARLAGVSLPTLSGALNGNGNFNVRWLQAWPAEFWHEFLPLLRAEREASPEAVRQLKRERLKTAINELIEIADIA